MDASRGGSPGFYFRPPIAPVTDYPGKFDRNVRPTVVVCEWLNGACVGNPVAAFSVDSSAQSGRRIQVDASSYSAVWKTSREAAMLGKVYRVQVWARDFILGHADILIVRTRREAEQLPSTQFVPLELGAALPIRFRIEQGAIPRATAEIGSLGGQIRLPGIATLDVPPGAFPTPTTVTLQATSSGVVTAMYSGVTTAVFEAGPRMPHEVRVVSSAGAPSQPLLLTLTPSPSFRNALPSSMSLQPFAQMWQESSWDSNDLFEPVGYTEAQGVAVALDADHFATERRTDGQTEAVVLIGSVPRPALGPSTGARSRGALGAHAMYEPASGRWLGACDENNTSGPIPALLARPILDVPFLISSLYRDSSGPPVPGKSRSGSWRIPLGKARRHPALDISTAGHTGVRVFAAHDGTVSVNDTQLRADGKGWGHFVVIRNDAGTASTLYAHLQERSPKAIGTPVKAGDEIGKSGESGANGRPHLHLEYFVGRPLRWELHGAPRYDPDGCLPVVISPTTPQPGPLSVGQQLDLEAVIRTSDSNIDNDGRIEYDTMLVGAPTGVYPVWSSSNPSVASVTATGTGEVAVVTALSPGTTDIVISGQGGSAKWSIQVQGGVVTPPLPAPSGLTARAVGSRWINVDWTDNSSDEDFFVVEYSLSPSGPFTNQGTLANVTRVDVAGLAPGSTHYLRVAATRGNVTSAYSNTVTVRTLSEGHTGGSAAAVIGSDIFVVGAQSSDGAFAWGDISSYNASTDAWQRRMRIGAGPGLGSWNSPSGAVPYQGRLYMTGGAIGGSAVCSQELFIFDPNTNALVTAAENHPIATCGGSAGVVNDKLYVYTEWFDSSSNKMMSAFYAYDLIAGTWSAPLATPSPSAYARKGTVVGNKFYLVGGADASTSAPVGDVEVFTPTTGLWSHIPSPMPTPRYSAAIASDGSRLYAVGGYNKSNGSYCGQRDEVEYLDTVTNAWVSLPRLRHARISAVAAVVGQSLYVTGGRVFCAGVPGDVTSEIEFIDVP
ncbi:MAG: peptidoglycan DD-metalloendopeptidase family protein [Gemmatimonadaceae bacterium]